MTDDERFAGRYREQAIHYAALRQTQPATYELRCDMCHTTITASVSPRERMFDPARAQRRLADRAVKEGWDTDSSGRLACATCHAYMVSRVKKTADAQGDGG